MEFPAAAYLGASSVVGCSLLSMPSDNKNRVYGGFSHLEGGSNDGIAPDLLAPNQCSEAVNFTFRDGYARTRPPWTNLVLTYASDTVQTNIAGKFQGAVMYPSEYGLDGFVVSVGGRLFLLTLGLTNVWTEITPNLTVVVTAQFTVPAGGSQVFVNVTTESVFTVGQTIFIDSGQYTVAAKFTDQIQVTYVSSAANATVATGTLVLDSGSNNIIDYQTNVPTDDSIYLFPAENYIIVCGGQHSTVFFDGSRARLAGIGEIPPGVLGIYAWGRIWMALSDRRRFIAGDLIRESSGTPALGFVDAILKTTENTFLNGGGAFAVPNNAGPITSMMIQAILDTSLGTGPVLVGTTNSVVSVNAPVDRTTWQNLTYPIQTMALVDYGPAGPCATAAVNGDIWFRSPVDIRSFIIGRRDSTTLWGNTPMSHEVSDILRQDTDSLIQFASIAFFDNKLFTTASPARTPNGIVHRGLVCVNYDLISTMNNKTAPAWEGVLTGLNILKVLKGNIGGRERCFMFVQAEDGVTIELWEMQKTGSYDLFTSVSNGVTSIAQVPIQSSLDTALYPFDDISTLDALETCEIFLDEIVDDVTLVIKYSPDEYPNWFTWATVNICVNRSQCTLQAPIGGVCQVFQQNAMGYAARIMLPRPDDSMCNVLSGKPSNWGYEFSFRIEGTGHFRLKTFRPHALIKSDKMTGDCQAAATCVTVPACEDSFFTYNSHGS
jgi:hypothetical protein